MNSIDSIQRATTQKLQDDVSRKTTCTAKIKKSVVESKDCFPCLLIFEAERVRCLICRKNALQCTHL